MPQSHACLYAHLIFSTKDRYPFLDTSVRDRVHAYLAETVRNMGSSFSLVGGVADHVHLLFERGRVHAAKDFSEEIKRESSKFIKTFGGKHSKFYWQRGYGIFSVSPPHRSAVESYIRNQEEHHRVKTFQEEYRDFLRRYDIQYDERYVWD
ncbi:transposase [Rhodopirellula sp. SM50]|nr:IS200/IS605 family transposase [Rhodopirellula sp. SM50]PAY20447.1 transposase [Rhodopirellula sp. SM50]